MVDCLQRGGLQRLSDAEQGDGHARWRRVLASAGQTAQLVQNRHHVLPFRRPEMST